LCLRGCTPKQPRRGSLAPVDAPLGETREQYRLNISAQSASLEWLCDRPALTIAASELAVLGAGAAHVEVRQLGDCAASHPATAPILIS
jgi:hypothetical protein